MNYYEFEILPILKQIKRGGIVPSFRFERLDNDISYIWYTTALSVNNDSLDALERFIMEARIILNRKDLRSKAIN